MNFTHKRYDPVRALPWHKMGINQPQTASACSLVRQLDARSMDPRIGGLCPHGEKEIFDDGTSDMAERYGYLPVQVGKIQLLLMTHRRCLRKHVKRSPWDRHHALTPIVERLIDDPTRYVVAHTSVPEGSTVHSWLAIVQALVFGPDFWSLQTQGTLQ